MAGLHSSWDELDLRLKWCTRIGRSVACGRADGRYSDEFKYRPAASPIITEKLKDGRIRIRGATAGGLGLREGIDIPLSPAKKKLEEKKRREKAEAEALEKVLEAKRKAKERRKRRKSARSDP